LQPATSKPFLNSSTKQLLSATAQRISEGIASFAGTLGFLAVQAIFVASWTLFNSLSMSGMVFDPYPFNLLALIGSLEAIFLALFILMSQNRLQRQANQRAHLDLQISLLSEAEATKTLEMLLALCAHFGLYQAEDSETQELIARTNPEGLLADIKQSLPEAG
jgi:uncharacterized membrane protein